MRRDLRLHMYDNIGLDVYFSNLSDIANLPRICYTNGDAHIEHILFLVDESRNMETYINGIQKWFFVKEYIIKKLMRYYGTNVQYSYMSSKDAEYPILSMNEYDKNDALDWIDNRELSYTWNASETMGAAHTRFIHKEDCALIIITTDNNCLSYEWEPTIQDGLYYNHYNIFSFNDLQLCESRYYHLWEKIALRRREFVSSTTFDFRYISTREDTNKALIDLCDVYAIREFHQISPGEPNQGYIIDSNRIENFLFETDENGDFQDHHFNLLPSNMEMLVRLEDDFEHITKCPGHEDPEFDEGSEFVNFDVPDTISENPPTNSQYVHFAEFLLGDESIRGYSTKINEETDESHILGSGEFSDADSILENINSIDGIAISENVRLIAYSDKNFEGDVIIDITGPVLLNDVSLAISDDDYKIIHSKTFTNGLQDKYPTHYRIWLYEPNRIKSGSFKIIFK